ncbi:hypothetical protein SAMN05428978_102435 [Nitrosomonas sp. Nm34]|nr:hypothetical protein SAMN05428978_102435 [Nitrosomonas sp. Nm34]
MLNPFVFAATPGLRTPKRKMILLEKLLWKTSQPCTNKSLRNLSLTPT